MASHMGILQDPSVIRQLPRDLIELIRTSSGAEYLDALSVAALEPKCTNKIFELYEPIFVDLAARWLSPSCAACPVQILSAFARILPFAPSLRMYADEVVQSRRGPLSYLAGSKQLDLLEVEHEVLHNLLLAIFRLLSFDQEAFSGAISPIQVQSLMRHPNRSIRYLAIRCFCLYMHAADAAMGEMIKNYVGEGPIEGQWEHLDIDYRFLSLWEEKRWEDLEKGLQSSRGGRKEGGLEATIKELGVYLSNRTAQIGGVLVPKLRLDGKRPLSSLVKTPTTMENLRLVGNGLLRPTPLLLVGQQDSGKTSLVTDVAEEMGQASSMITLHLNEQTDAKSLLGMYAISSVAGSFTWQPGVLTKAVREGRWVLIEDLDRAPSEVMGLILPLIEKNELVIPSRRERIRCADGFRVIATMRSSLNVKGEEIAPTNNMLGSRLWEQILVRQMSLEEIRDIISHKFPLLVPRLSTITNVYSRMRASLQGSLTARSSQGKTPGLRDVIKFCSRISLRLRALGVESGFEATPDATQDEIFLDAFDCFVAHLSNPTVRLTLASIIAEEMQVSPQRMQFCLAERIPAYSDQGGSIVLGREVCEKAELRTRSTLTKTQLQSNFAPTRPALRTMEQVAAALRLSEPTLLVGETGIGKTASIQQLAKLLRKKLTVVNLSQQSESSDLLGGFKPISIRSVAVPMVDEFNQLFELTFSAKKNQKFISSVAKSLASSNWTRLVTLWKEAVRMAKGVFETDDGKVLDNNEPGRPPKKRRLDSSKYSGLWQRWKTFDGELAEFEVRVSQGDAKFAFAFVPGKIVKALRNGEWVLLDEINLASPDTLENIASLLHHGNEGPPSVLLSEAGDVERVIGHPGFRIFGAMNPATDAGKRDLAPGLRSRFTEIYVESPDSDINDLVGLIQAYLGGLTNSDERATPDLANLYMDIKKLNLENKLTDGAGQKPHLSIRTLVRTLVYVKDHAHIYGLRRAIYEGFSMSFLTMLSQESERLLTPFLDNRIFGSLKNSRSLLGKTPRAPEDGHEYVQFKHYWMRKGAVAPELQPHYIVTPFIEKNLMNLVRASSTKRFPILLQGPTSSGKTSMVDYLAKISGNKFVRINNHEHTDLQEYLGSYVSGEDGTLRYQEGVLVEALRHGYWIVLDELNLAPTDVLEALNRLLDDNRELFVPETQEVIRPHPNFMLFATQNPAGLYGGRKVLSRAFRNRFLELHFDDIPEDELEYILRERSQVAPSFCTRIVSVYRKLSLLRQSNRLFEQRNSFATLRDLFRWALRRADDREQLAINGFMLLAERVRNPHERASVKAVIEEVMRVSIDENAIYGAGQLEKRILEIGGSVPTGIIWTKAMRRLLVLVSQAIENNEPVLLVGETGCGKTQLCQAAAEIYAKQLYTINAHVNLETGDLIGTQRPLRNRAAIEQELCRDIRSILSGCSAEPSSDDMSLDDLVNAFSSLTPESLASCPDELPLRVRRNLTRSKALFEWSDGSLVTAMKTGQFFLLDEVSLADDSVLERLNSVLEPHRSLFLAEKGPIDSMVVAEGGFQFLATMNPGGDYGKRELSAALRNRLTEIWVPELSEDDDILPILSAKVRSPLPDAPKAMLDFAKWFKATFQNSSTNSISIRDILSWVDFVNTCLISDAAFAMVHGAAMVFIDTLGANPAGMLAIASGTLEDDRQTCLKKLGELFRFDASDIYHRREANVFLENGILNIGPFPIPVSVDSHQDPEFIMDAPTTVVNSIRIARGLQSAKPILLEGSPGVGKTTLVATLARAIGKPLTRINLSEQTDLTDLFGSDVPVEGGDVGHFAWRDAPFLRAMQQGGWVLLDEMNLASQSVLEGLNSCLDHRQQVYVAELDQTFMRHPDFFLFATQNPHHQGGGRKGLPASFVNRFTVVYADSFSDSDLERICKKLFTQAPQQQVENLVTFISTLNKTIVRDRRLGAVGGPWEINLRDISRWLKLMNREPAQLSAGNFLDVVISQRFRTKEDRQMVAKIYHQIFQETPSDKSFFHNLTPNSFQVGLGVVPRDSVVQPFSDLNLKISPEDLPIIESLLLCVDQAWPSILVGPSGSGKTSILRKVAMISGAQLVELSLNADTDTMDLIGGFEQVSHQRHVSAFIEELAPFLQHQAIEVFTRAQQSNVISDVLELYHLVSTECLQLDTLRDMLSSFMKKYPVALFETFYKRCQALLQSSTATEKAGFEWTEGLFIQALQNGHWVVLDNANLCNSSVLDRLNSLMEPDGSLILNEQRLDNGEARIVRPHPNFRLFLTMDSRHGELSRAMRNRSVEICLPQRGPDLTRIPQSPTYSSESLLHRLRSTRQLNDEDVPTGARKRLLEVLFDHLNYADFDALNQLFLDAMAPTLIDARDVSDMVSRYALFQEKHQGSLLNEQLAQVSMLYRGAYSLITQQDIQPFHPLVNEPALVMLHSNSQDSRNVQLGRLQDLQLNLYELRQVLTQINESALSRKPSEMTLLERSMASGRIPSLLKDPTQPVAGFFLACVQSMESFLSLEFSNLENPNALQFLRSILELCWDMIRLTQCKVLDVGIFQIYLQVGRTISSSLESSYPPVAALKTSLSGSLDAFGETWNLTTGLSIQRLWDLWRPATPTDLEHLRSMIELEMLSSRFDRIIFKARVPLSQLSQVRNSLLEAQASMLMSNVNGELLVKNLSQIVEDLESILQDDRPASRPYFSEQFETLCQYNDLTSSRAIESESESSLSSLLQLLASRSTRPSDTSNLNNPVPGLLGRISCFSGLEGAAGRPTAIQGSLSVSLLGKLVFAKTVDLGQIELLESELGVLSQGLSSVSGDLGTNQFRLLQQELSALLYEIMSSHRDLLDPRSLENALPAVHRLREIGSAGGVPNPEILKLELQGNSTEGHFFKSVTNTLLKKIFPALSGSGKEDEEYQVGAMCIRLSLACLRLFVPDRPFDPSLGLVVKRDRHAERASELKTKLTALERFEVMFSGKNSNLRHKLVQEEIQELGSDPPSPPVTRPSPSQLNELQGEFMNLLNSVLKRDPEDTILGQEDNVNQALDQGHLLRENIQQICGRLKTLYRPYDDITVPVVRFLQLLDLGISIVQSSKVQPSSHERSIRIISERTPFLGGNPESLLKPEHPRRTAIEDVESQLHRLSMVAFAQRNNPDIFSAVRTRVVVQEIFGYFYDLWKTQLKADQEKESEKSKTYHYRGSREDDEEADNNDFSELFPTFEETSETDSSTEKPQIDPTSISRKLSLLHQSFFATEDSEAQLQALVKDSARLIGSIASKDRTIATTMNPKTHLAGVMLILNDQMQGVEQTVKNFNFYADPNLAEAKKFVTLVRSIESRFSQIRNSWPEHATLQDVITCCLEIYQFEHQEPIAKFITKAEKLHAFVYEWQLVASREFSASQLYDELTNMLISWRRLELSTWARLLDIEKEKCDQDASSWWFVAYEVIIAVPLQLASSGEDLLLHTEELIATLSTFFGSTTLGQYSPRMRMLENFKKLLSLYEKDLPALSRVTSALANFLQHYVPFEPIIEQALADGRKTLEKDIKQEIQLASWKDTNITALKESARRSHNKLFKVVRKYRALLTQGTDSVIARGIPKVTDQPEVETENNAPIVCTPDKALAICQDSLTFWSSRPTRFKDPGGAVKSMRRVYSAAFNDFYPSDQIDMFVCDVVDSIKDLKSRTPKTLTEENKDDVQHLKAQKRRFYAEKLKNLRHMGIRSNVGTDILEKQATIPAILAKTSNFGTAADTSATLKSADSYFHRLLDLVPRVRQASREYSEELSNVEAARSTGFVEGMLFSILGQRDVLAPVLLDDASLKVNIQHMVNMWSYEGTLCRTGPGSAHNKTDLSGKLTWLSTIIGVGVSILRIHAGFGQMDFSAITASLQNWKEQLNTLITQLQQSKDFPNGLSSEVQENMVTQARAYLADIKSEACRFLNERPDISFVLEQIIPWTELGSIPDLETNTDKSSTTIEAIDKSLLNAMDMIFVSLQRIDGSLKSSPTSTEDAGWLAKSSQALAKATKELHISEISHAIASVLNQLQYLSSETGVSTGAALIATVLPIIQQYQSICDDVLGKYLSLHREICKMAYIMAQSFTQIASEGFCSPSEASNEDGETGKLESGTGLGEGEGAEDISKDVQDDEDLSELAQQQKAEDDKEEIEDTEDAVNMDQEELEGDTGDFEEDKDKDGESGSEDDENEEGDIDEEVGSVDGLDPSAVDEKLWDGEQNEDQKETENEQGKGTTQSEDQTAAPDQDKNQDGKEEESGEQESEEEAEEPPEDEGEAVGREETDAMDPHAKEEETLDLPEEMQLDGEEKEGADSDMDDGMNELSDVGDAQDDEQVGEQDQAENDMDDPEPETVENEAEKSDDGDEMDVDGGEEAEPPNEDETQPEDTLLEQRDDNENAPENMAPSEAIFGGLGNDQDQQDKQGASGDAEQDHGSKDMSNELEKQSGAADEGADDTRKNDSAGGADDLTDNSQAQAFKQLGDVLEQWHRRRQQIMEASTEKEESQNQEKSEDIDMAEADFEHLADDQDIADTQALGQASEEQAKGLDQSNGVESGPDEQKNNDAPPEAMEEDQDVPNGEGLEHEMQTDQVATSAENRGGTFIASDNDPQMRQNDAQGQMEAEEILDDVDTHLAAIHLSSELAPLTPPDEARRLWSHYESVTHDLSLSLTEQLRLILAPTLATKLRGDFRTGKRLNIKRIIPYIASQYKRDKIWMRRSVPSKRNYQIMLAVDDSKSMLESGSGKLAFETLALVARSLSMLEVGDLCIVNFGNEDHVRVAHEFGKPFSSEAGSQIFQQFSYQQTGTNVRKLVADSIALFREARTKRAPGGGNADLWQLELIVSDGICEDHDTIRRLVRQAQEERIMIVFIIVDATKGNSILNLTQASFEPDEASGTGEMKLKMKRYLEGFPFPYYLVVSDVRELPAVLAMALKQWFAEVVDVST
ncbi:AAA ATPase midasin [Arachnomyces sp. PD_36]|nr:AAA ATPase midasin [Arachnomyces sp. PD_36]